jgi:hypothetical protein
LYSIAFTRREHTTGSEPRDTFETMRSAVVAVALFAGRALAQEASPSPVPSPSPAPRATLFSAIDPTVAAWWSANHDPCRGVSKGVPCFPVEIQAEGPTVSVLGSLYHLDDAKRPEHRPPTMDEMREARPGTQSAIGNFFSTDPVCAVKKLVKTVKGKHDTWYLYRIRDTGGSHVVMKDEKLDATYVQGDVEYLGKFDGECAALQAFRHEDRK